MYIAYLTCNMHVWKRLHHSFALHEEKSKIIYNKYKLYKYKYIYS